MDNGYPVDLSDMDGKTPLHGTTDCGKKDTVKVLLNNYAKTNWHYSKYITNINNK